MSIVDNVFKFLGYTPTSVLTASAQPATVEKANTEREAIAQNPLAMAYASVNTQWGLRKPSKITFQTLRRMSQSNWVDRACIETLRDEVTAIPWDIVPVNPKESYDPKFQQFIKELLIRPNRNNENWRTLIQKVVEDILVVDAGCIEKVRNKHGVVTELWHVDGATIKPMFDEHGVVGEPAYQQFLPGQRENKPLAEWNNPDFIYIMWNPQGGVDTFGYGMSPVEAGLAVGTAFLYAEAYTLGFFKTNTIPPMIINMGKEVPPAEIDKFRAFLAAEMMGNQGFHAPVIASFNEGFDVKNLLTQPKDMAWKEYLEWQMKWKVALYRMSPQDIGFNTDMYKLEGEVQQELSKNKAINSLKNVIKQYIDAEIIGDFGFKEFNYNLQFNWIDADVVDPIDQANVDKIYLSTGVKTINEIRQREGLDPIVGGQKPLIVSGQTVMQLDPTPMITDDKDSLQPVGKSLGSVEKVFSPEEGVITTLKTNQEAICWMDDRGVTQPLFVTDDNKEYGFQIKPAFLDEKRGQEPPEAEVARLLRAMKVNTPEVQIMTYEQVLQLMPDHLYSQFTKWISLEPPFDSQTWRQRWGNTRQSNYYIVTGYLTGVDLGNHDLQKMMITSPESYLNAVQDLAKVWVAERVWYLGDRKPGHYIITKKGNGFGVDYQFFKTKEAWEKSNHFLPKTLDMLSDVFKESFDKYVEQAIDEFGTEDLGKFLSKTYRRHLPKKWQNLKGLDDIEKDLSQAIQKGILRYFRKAVHIVQLDPSDVVKPTLEKANKFDPTQSYITNGNYVYQNGVKFPVTVINNNDVPSVDDITLSEGDYTAAADYGMMQAQVLLDPQVRNTMSITGPFAPDDPRLSALRVSMPDLYLKVFAQRADQTSGVITDTLGTLLDQTLVRGIDNGESFAEIGTDIQSAFGIDPNDPTVPGWRADRIARTETNYAVNEGMRQSYENVGMTYVNVSPAADACDICESVADGNPYNVQEANGLLPVHPNCRCVLVGDYDQFLKNKEVEKHASKTGKVRSKSTRKPKVQAEKGKN